MPEQAASIITLQKGARIELSPSFSRDQLFMTITGSRGVSRTLDLKKHELAALIEALKVEHSLLDQ